MRATELLMEEHAVIREGLVALEAVAVHVGARRGDPPAGAAELLALLDEFAEQAHHAREEELLFPALAEAGARVAALPLEVMRREHAHGRNLLRVLRESLPGLGRDAGARRRFLDAAELYRDHLLQHIQKEDQVLFRIAEQLLDPEAARALDAAFERTGGGPEAGLPARLRRAASEVVAGLEA